MKVFKIIIAIITTIFLSIVYIILQAINETKL